MLAEVRSPSSDDKVSALVENLRVSFFLMFISFMLKSLFQYGQNDRIWHLV